MGKQLILTCSLCNNYCPNKQTCKLNNAARKPEDSSFASVCNEQGKFVRYMYVIPNSYNYFAANEDVPPNWSLDMNKIPTDGTGRPLVVRTKRGVERAIPANSSVLLKVDQKSHGTVPPITTYQGQREIIYQMGVKLASEEAEKAGVTLTVLPDEKDSQGIPEFVNAHLSGGLKNKPGGKAWITEKPVKWNY